MINLFLHNLFSFGKRKLRLVLKFFCIIEEMKYKLIFLCLFLIYGVGVFAQRDTVTIKTPEGKASYYAKSFQGRKTACGDLFDNADYTAAHRTLPFNTYLNVVNKKNNYNVIVRVNDRGPFVKNRIIDLSEAAARRIGGYHAGLIRVKIEVLNILKPGSFIDSVFTAAAIVNCFGKVEQPDGLMLSLWKSNDLVHAIYIANDLLLKENVNAVYIANRERNGIKEYHVVIGDIADKADVLKLKNYYEDKGFMNVVNYTP
jgi:rare lipoprotein A